jgi:hypothetical protein
MSHRIDRISACYTLYAGSPMGILPRERMAQTTGENELSHSQNLD